MAPQSPAVQRVGRGGLASASPPEHMSEVAQRVWHGVVQVLVSEGMLREPDLFAVEMLCEAYADFATADNELRNNWISMERQDGSRVPVLSRYVYKIDGFGNRIASLHPAYAAKREASSAIKQWLGELGMTPAARARIVGSVHGLPSTERSGDDDDVPLESMKLDDLDVDDRAAMREILQRRLVGSKEPVES